MDQGDSGGGRPLANFAALGAGEVATRVVAFAVAAILTRRIGAAGFGDLAFATAITSYLFLAPHLALGELAGRAVARSPERAGPIVASVTRVRLFVTGLGLLAVCILAVILPLSPTLKALLVLGSLGAVPQVFNVSWAYKALERTGRVGTGLILGQVILLVLVLVFVHAPGDLLRIPVLQAVAEAGMALLLIPLVLAGWSSGNVRDGLQLLRGAGAAVTNRMLRTLIITADMVMLGFLADASEVGLYAAGYRVCFLLMAIASSAHVVYQPALMRAYGDAKQASAVLTDALGLVWVIGLPLVAGGMLVAPDLLAFLFGEPFRAAHPSLRILLLSIGFLFVHGVFAGAFLARHQLGLQARIVAVAAGLNLVLNAILIPSMGIVGAATATAAAEGVILAFSVVVLYRSHWRPGLRPLLRPAIAVMGMAVGLVTMPTAWEVLVRIGIAGLIYCGLLIATGGVPRELTAIVARGVGRRDDSSGTTSGERQP